MHSLKIRQAFETRETETGTQSSSAPSLFAGLQLCTRPALLDGLLYPQSNLSSLFQILWSYVCFYMLQKNPLIRTYWVRAVLLPMKGPQLLLYVMGHDGCDRLMAGLPDLSGLL